MQIEIGSKNHEVVPTPLIVQISGLSNGGVNKLIGSLAKRNLVARVQNAKCQSTIFAIVRYGLLMGQKWRRWLQTDVLWGIRLRCDARTVQT